jgi:hypothetical protein
MLKRVKKWLGIEGIKLELMVPESISKDKTAIVGTVRFYSMNPQSVTAIHLKFIEKYARGRRKSRMTDEYVLIEKEIPVLIEVPAHEMVEYPFTLPFEIIRSKMDELEAKNFFLRGLVKAAKTIKAVNSEYRLEVEADVLGTALNPFDKKVIALK